MYLPLLGSRLGMGTHQRARDTSPSSTSLGLTDYSQVARSNLALRQVLAAPRIFVGLKVGGDLCVAPRGRSYDVALRQHFLRARSAFSPAAKRPLHLCYSRSLCWARESSECGSEAEGSACRLRWQGQWHVP